jgi:hypothetical protein
MAWSQSAAPATYQPQNWQAASNAAGAAPQAGTQAPVAAAPVNAMAPRMDQGQGWIKLAALAADFGTDFKGFLAESTQGGIGMNTFNAFMGGDMEVGKDLSVMFTKMVKDRDLKAARTDLDGAKPKVKPTSRFAKYVTNVDETLRAMGF